MQQGRDGEILTISFLAPKSFVNISFWEELYRRKLDMYGLNSERIPIRAFLSPSEGENLSALTVSKESYEGLHSFFFYQHQFHFISSFLSSSDPSSPSLAEMSTTEVSIPGSLLNVNTVQAFKDVDKKGLIEEVGGLVRDAIESKRYLEDPSTLQRFVLLSFADLKGAILLLFYDHRKDLSIFIDVLGILYFLQLIFLRIGSHFPLLSHLPILSFVPPFGNLYHCPAL